MQLNVHLPTWASTLQFTYNSYFYAHVKKKEMQTNLSFDFFYNYAPIYTQRTFTFLPRI